MQEIKGTEFDRKFVGQIAVFGLAVTAISTLLVYACGESKPEKQSKYKQGDVVWLKPDSTRAVITDVISSDYYNIRYYDSEERKPKSKYVSAEYEIYSKVN
jgi:uncharacterized protein YodC (DUF2158 family)